MSSTNVYPDQVTADVCSTIFAALPRCDQRRKGTEYVHGLLGAEGRKSIRNIATLIGGPAAEQSLHHFICSSTWDWRPVRRALAELLTGPEPPLAWVMRPMVIPKAGKNSVGVHRRFFPELGQLLNCQEACGVWAAWPDRGMPVNWRMQLSPDEVRQAGRRGGPAIPDELEPESPGECAVRSCVEVMADWKLPVRPVVLDARRLDPLAVLRRLRAARVPALVRINGTVPLDLPDRGLPGHGARVQADRLLIALRNMRRPVHWRTGAAHRPAPVTMATTAVVRDPVGGPETLPRDLLLIGVEPAGAPAPRELWLTTLIDTPVADLLRLARLPGRVDRDCAEITDGVGLRDFTGRSFGGWHRHVTLASAAHAIAVLGGDRAQVPPVARLDRARGRRAPVRPDAELAYAS
ncbi:IS701 family transposase [Rhizomonospora bruguierae]|uniref:IS701 family transposase n=1 Tax=Rhizomonospora bruguierae TaxID=1581705 RepID=UPI001BCBBE60|nr:transposase [Micromonospora sp. NBRC 107566]